LAVLFVIWVGHYITDETFVAFHFLVIDRKTILILFITYNGFFANKPQNGKTIRRILSCQAT